MKFDEQIAGPTVNSTFPPLTSTSSVSAIVGPGRMSQCARVSVRILFGPSTTQGAILVQASADQHFTNPITITTINWAAANQAQAAVIPPEWHGGFWRLKPTTAVDGEGAQAWASGQRS